MTGYKLTREDCGTWMFAGTTVQEVLNTLKTELECDFEEPNHNYRCTFQITPFEVTQEEIDNMPDFEGW